MNIDINPTRGQELRVSRDLGSITLGDVTITVPGETEGLRADWLMGFWEDLTDTLARNSDPTHLCVWARRATQRK